ncbi:MAG: hypothetical protein GKR87_06835 [Kiritimatiellae bacterium]|nr:hypothetical protein [Kiritimatiellia bacterium]
MKPFLAVFIGMLITTILSAQDDLQPLGDKFSYAQSASQWKRIYQEKGWVADQLETWNINPSLPIRGLKNQKP